MTLFLRVDTAQLHGHGDQLNSSCEKVDQGLQDLDRELRNLAESWEGASAEGFRAVMDAWRQTQQELLADLRVLREAVHGAADNYQAAEDANDTMWSGR